MTSAFALPISPVRPTAQMPVLPVQAAGFEAVLSVSSTSVAEAPVMPVARCETISSPPVVQENESAMVAVPEADLDAAIRPLLTAFGGDAAPISITVISQFSVSDKPSVPEIESDDAQSVQRECAEIVVPALVFVPTPIVSSAIVATIVTPAELPVAASIAKANQTPKAATSKDGAPVIEPEGKISARTDAVSVPNIGARQNIAPWLPPATQDAPPPVHHAGAISFADLAGMLASTPVESNSVFGAGFQTIMTERIADTAIRPLTDASALVADRALDVARGSLWLDQLAGDIAAVQDKDCDLAFRLIPAQLGQLDVKIATSEDGMQLNFSTQTEEAARIISGAQARLVEELKAQGVRVAGSEVNAGSGQSSFTQQNSYPVRREIITEFDRPSPDFPEPTHANDPQTGRFA